MHFWSVARYDLHLGDAEFFRLTPRKLDALLGRRKVAVEAREVLFAQLAEKIVNWGIRAPKEPAKITDFMPSQWAVTAKARGREQYGSPIRMTARRRRRVAEQWEALMSRGFAGCVKVETAAEG